MKKSLTRGGSILTQTAGTRQALEALPDGVRNPMFIEGYATGVRTALTDLEVWAIRHGIRSMRRALQAAREELPK